MNQTLKNVLILAVSIAFAFGAYFAVTSIARTNEINSMSAEFRTSFMQGCEEEGSKALCTCIYNDLEERLGTVGIYDMAMQYEETGVISDKAYASVWACI